MPIQRPRTAASGGRSPPRPIIWPGFRLSLIRSSTRRWATRAVCFTEVPLSGVQYFVGPKDKPRYSHYGIAVSKEAAFKRGARPVIYLPDNEADWIPDEHKWRHVRFEFGKVDWTHEREWRLPGDLDLRKLPGIYVLVETGPEAEEIVSLDPKKVPVRKLIRGVLPMMHLNQML
jgi:hypothetical protein